MHKPNRATIQITKSNGQLSYTFWEDDGERDFTTSRLEEVEKLIGMKGLRVICADQICAMLNGNWDGNWESLEEGATYVTHVRPPLTARQKAEKRAQLEFRRSSQQALQTFIRQSFQTSLRRAFEESAWQAFLVFIRHAFRSARGDTTELTMQSELFDFPRLWELFGFALRKRTRERIFEPAQQDLLAQYLKAQRFSGKWERRWLTMLFTLHTIGLVLSCWRVATIATAIGFGLRFVPPGVKEWVLSLLR